MLIGRAVLLEVTRSFLGALTAATGLAFFATSLAFMKKAPGIGLGILLELFPLFFPMVLQFTVPLSALMAVVVTFSRMQADRELTVLSASGVTLFTVVWPVLAAAALLSVASLLLIDIATPFAAARLRDAQRDLAQTVQTSFRSGLRDIEFDRARLSFQKFERGEFGDILIEIKQAEGRPRMFRAKNGSLEITDEDQIRFAFRPLHVMLPTQKGSGRLYVSLEEFAGDLNLDEDVLTGGARRKRNDLYAWELAYASRRLKAWEARHAHLEKPKDRKYRARIDSLDAIEELARRTALAGSSFFFALAGIGLGILAGNKAKVAGVITACAPIILLYFPLIILGSNLARSGVLPPYPALWMGNVILFVGGSAMLYRVARR